VRASFSLLSEIPVSKFAFKLNLCRYNVAQALNFQSVPEDFKYDYAAHAASVAREQKAAATAATAVAAAALVAYVAPRHHRRTDSGESSASVIGGVTGATPRLASPEYEGQAAQQTTAAANGRSSGGLFGERGGGLLGGGGGGGGGGRGGVDSVYGQTVRRGSDGYQSGDGHYPTFGAGALHQSTTSTVSSVATPPFPGQGQGLKAVRTSNVSVLSTTSTVGLCRLNQVDP
jgi:hypothetical protein